LTLNQANLSDIDITASANTIVDVFVYDTTKDSDGGNWTTISQNTSWYNEPLNTATRGATKEFPAIAIIVAEAIRVTIYDATKQDTPMWMIFETSGTVNPGVFLSRRGGSIGSNSTISMMNGLMCVGVNGSSVGTHIESFTKINFISEAVDLATTSNESSIADARISNRNGNNYVYGPPQSTDIGLDNHQVNVINMTVLDNASIDPLTNLPIPTIYVGTDGGLSRIDPDSTITTWSTGGAEHTSNMHINDKIVSFSYDNNAQNKYVKFRKTNEFLTTDLWYTGASLVGWTGKAENFSTVDKNIFFNNTDLYINDLSYNTIATNNSLTLTKIEDYDDVSKSLHCTITKDFISGWQFGDIKGAFLANSKISDRSYNNNSLTEVGTITEGPVETGAELKAYSGFSATNYLTQPYNSDLNFGTGDFHMMAWVKFGNNGFAETVMALYNNTGAKNYCFIQKQTDETVRFQIDSSSGASFAFSPDLGTDWKFIVGSLIGDTLSLYIDGLLIATNTQQISNDSFDFTDGNLNIGTTNPTLGDYRPLLGSLSLVRIGTSVPSDDQILEIYNSEKPLFRENSKCLLSSTTDSSVTSITYDQDKELLHATGSDNVDTFDGLFRVKSEVGTHTSISAAKGIVAKGN
jgi:hypothetical protein